MVVNSEANSLSIRLESRDEVESFAEAMDFVRRNMPAHRKSPGWRMLVDLSDQAERVSNDL